MSDGKEKNVNRREFMGILGSSSIGAAAMCVAATRGSASDLKDLEKRVAALESVMLSESFKIALLQLAQKVAYIDAGGPNYYQELFNSLFPDKTLKSISVQLELGNHTVKEHDPVSSLRQFLTVTAHFTDNRPPETVDDYVLKGSLLHGVNMVTVSYQEKTVTLSVKAARIVGSKYIELTHIAATGEQYIDTGLAPTQPASAEYEIAYTEMTNKGGHILSNDNTYFPFFKGSGALKKVFASNWGNEAPSSGTFAFAWELDKRYRLRAFPDIMVSNRKVATLDRAHRPGWRNYCLFTYAGDPMNLDYRFIGNLYSMKVYDENKKLLRDFVPCRNDEGVAGLYDKVTEAFFTSNTDAPLIAGEDI